MNVTGLKIVGGAVAAALALFLLVLWFFGIGFGDLMIIFTAIGTVFGAFYMDRYITKDEGGQRITDFWVLLMMRSALWLSVASFITSLFGMIDFVMGSDTSPGAYVVGWMIALAVTFAIQGMLLATSVELGRALQRMRRLSYEQYLDSPRDQLESLRYAKQQASGFGKWRSRFAILLILACLVAAFLLYTRFSVVGLISTTVRLVWPDGEGFSSWLIAALVLVPLPLMLALGWLRLPRGVPALMVLIGAFLFFLTFSSIFSYDNYYRIVQSDEDEAQRRGAIVRETVPFYLAEARQSMEAERFGLLEERANADFIDGMLSDLDAFVAIYRTNLDKIADDEQAMRETRRARKAAIQQEIEALRAEEQRELAATASMLGDQPAAEARVELLSEELAKLNEDRDRISAEIAAIRAEISENERLARCEEFGNANPEDNCANTSGIEGCDTRCEGYKAKAKDLLERVLPTPEAALARNRQDIAAKERELRDATVELQSIVDQATPVEGEENPVVTARREIRERYAAARKALQDEWAALDIIERRGGNFSADGLSTALADFRARPSTATAQAFTDQCVAARLDLTSAGVTDARVTAYDCAPPQMAAIARTAEDLDTAIATYQARCMPEQVIGYDTSDPTATPVILPAAETQDPAAEAPAGSATPATPEPTPATPAAPTPAPAGDPAAAPHPAAEPPAASTVGEPVVDAAAAPGAAETDQNAIPALREIINRTRSCLSSANFGQDGIAQLQVDLTELESIYLVSDADMRSSWQDLMRLNFFAVGAAILAVGGDLMVLIAGAWASYRRDSLILADVLNLDVGGVEAALKRAAAHHTKQGSAAVGMQRFLAYLEESRVNEPKDHFFRSTLNLAKVSEEDRRLVDDIMRALPTTMTREVTFVPVDAPPGTVGERRRAILQSMVDFMTFIAHSEQNGTGPQTATARPRPAGGAGVAGIGDLGQMISAAIKQTAKGGTASAPDKPDEPVHKKPEAEI